MICISPKPRPGDWISLNLRQILHTLWQTWLHVHWQLSEEDPNKHACELEYMALTAFFWALSIALLLCSDLTSTFSSFYTYSAPKTWDMPPPSPTAVSDFPDVVPTHPFDILPHLAPEPFDLAR